MQRGCRDRDICARANCQNNIADFSLLQLHLRIHGSAYSSHQMDRSFAQLTSLFKRSVGAYSYKYSPLDEENHEIRLLTLLPGRFSEDIQINLRTERLTTTQIPKYEALSYVWGSTKSPKTIFISAHDQLRRTLAVTQNLAQALQYLRLKDDSRVLWIDAICINQEDLVERSKQVKRMADLYQLASRVVIWLGEEKDKSTQALKTFEQLSTKIEVDFVVNSAKPVLNEPSEQHWADIGQAPPLKKEQWLAMSHLLARPWFERLWIWQEAHLANQQSVVMCGLVEMSWSAFCSSALFLSLKPYSHLVESKGYRENVQRAADLCNK